MNWTEDCSLKSCVWEHRDPIDSVNMIPHLVSNRFQICETYTSIKTLIKNFRYRLYAYYCSHWHFSCSSYMTTPSCRTWIWPSYHTPDTQIDQSLDWFRLSPMVYRISCTIPKKSPGQWIIHVIFISYYHIHIRILYPSSQTCTCTPVGILLQLGKVLENNVNFFWDSFSGVVWFPPSLSKTSS